MEYTLAYRMQIETWGLDLAVGMAHTGFQGQGRGWGGMGPGRGCGHLICYNCVWLGHYTHECTNPMRIYFLYYSQFDLEAIDCPTLITWMHEKRVLQPTRLKIFKWWGLNHAKKTQMWIWCSEVVRPYGKIGGSSLRKIHGFTQLLQRNLSLTWNMQRECLWKITSQRPLFKVVRFNQSKQWILLCLLTF